MAQHHSRILPIQIYRYPCDQVFEKDESKMDLIGHAILAKVFGQIGLLFSQEWGSAALHVLWLLEWECSVGSSVSAPLGC